MFVVEIWNDVLMKIYVVWWHGKLRIYFII